MSTYYVCSDNINGKEKTYINAIVSALESKGHNARSGGVGPNTVQSHGLSSSSSGEIGVFIVGGSDSGMYADFVAGLKRGYYHYKHMWVVFASNTATTDKWITCNGLANTKLVRAHDDNYSGSSIESVGQTAKAYFQANKQYISYACGKLGCSFDDVVQNFLAGGGMGSDSGGESSASSIKDAICEVASFWDGEVEIKVEGDTCKLRKIPDPETDHLEDEIIEGVNVQLSSISIQDYHPDTVNFLTVHWQGGEDIVFRDEALIARFGEKPLELDAVKRVVSGDNSSSGSSMQVSQNVIEKFKSRNQTKDNTTTENNNITGAAGDDTDTDTSTDVDTDTETTSSTKYEEVPVTTYEEALSFANVEWAKIKRNNGHEIELKCIGNFNYKHAWIHVKLYSYPTDMWMYAKAISSELGEDGDLNTNITLCDYPPSLGEWEEEEADEETEEDTEELEDVTT
ncbi:MAG: hypothetical protein IJF83_05900 [Methanobrevibacter sp.]|nr:hypothetical protein [Methanobrevibacter sp.]